jgi:hypothetical protein
MDGIEIASGAACHIHGTTAAAGGRDACACPATGSANCAGLRQQVEGRLEAFCRGNVVPGQRPSATAQGAKPGRNSASGEAARPVMQPGGCAADTPAPLPGPLMHKGQLPRRSARKGAGRIRSAPLGL